MNMPLDEFKREEYLEKPLPSSRESERVILGAVFLDESVLPQAIERLKAEHFYSPLHRKIYKAMLDLFQRRERIDPVMIGEELKKSGSLEAVGGVAVITNLTFGLPHFSDIRDYVKKVEELARLRELIRACNNITSTALAEDDLPENVLSFAQSAINEVCTREDKKGFVSVADSSRESVVKIAELKEKGVQFTGLRTGFRDLDDKTGGLQKTDLIVLAGRPAMGKSSLGANLAERVCQHEREAVVAVFTLEMSQEQYTDRILCSMADVELQKYRTGNLTREDLEKTIYFQQILSGYRIFIDDGSSLSPLEARSKLMRLEAEQKRLDLVIIDYLQRMTSSQRTENRQQEVSRIARELKSLAKDFEVPVIAVSSLSRAPETRENKRPLMSDLRESGDIESEADVVALIFREEYYKPTEENAGIAELIIGKQRHGPTGTVKLAFMKEYTKFANHYEG